MSLLGPVGLLNRWLTIQSLSVIQDAAGQPIETWTAGPTVWMRIMKASGSERFAAQQVVGKSVSTFRIRYRTGLTINNTRVVYNGFEWDVHAIREVGLNEGLDLDCSARVEG